MMQHLEPKKKELINKREGTGRECSAIAKWILKLGETSRQNAKKRSGKV